MARRLRSCAARCVLQMSLTHSWLVQRDVMPAPVCFHHIHYNAFLMQNWVVQSVGTAEHALGGAFQVVLQDNSSWEECILLWACRLDRSNCAEEAWAAGLPGVTAIALVVVRPRQPAAAASCAARPQP